MTLLARAGEVLRNNPAVEISGASFRAGRLDVDLTANNLQVLDELGKQYVITARAKGLREAIVIARHALKNSLIPVVTVLGPLFAAVLTGGFTTETIFGIPGLGRHFTTNIGNRDYPVVMGTTLIYSVLLIVANLVVDVMYAFLDPRVRLS